LKAGLSVHIRLPNQVDLGKIAALVNSAYTVHQTHIGSQRTDADGLQKELAGEGALVVIEDGGEVVGSAVITPKGGALSFGLAAIHPDRQRQGLGRLLIHMAEAVAVANQMRTVSLEAERETGNVAYYEVLGYQAVDEWDVTPAGGAPYTVVRMEKRVA
jgi:predicted N-acetyltransferase YhbS